MTSLRRYCKWISGWHLFHILFVGRQNEFSLQEELHGGSAAVRVSLTLISPMDDRF